MKEAMWPKVNPLPGAETLIQRLISYNIPIAVCRVYPFLWFWDCVDEIW